MHHVQLLCGDDILPAEIDRLGDYAAVIDPVAWRLASPRILRTPAQRLTPEDLEQTTLDRLAAQLPAGLPLIGIGGGLVMDATKYLAASREQLAVLIPSITSSNAQFSDAIAVRRDGVPTGMRRAGAPKRIVVDFKLILAAEPRLNRAGYADLLAHETALGDALRGDGGRSKAAIAEVSDRLTAAMAKARAIAPDVGAVNVTGIRALMEMLHETTALAEAYPEAGVGAGSEHLFAWNLEAITGRHFSHGEVVALGVLAVSYVQGGDFEGLRDALRAAQVRFRPSELGLDWADVVRALRTVDDYNRRVRRWPSVFDGLEITDELVARLRQVIGD
jgi:glycerol-1-phosphate dehydrogenase [NAD(P)+]